MEFRRDGAEVDVWQSAIRSEFRTAAGHPAVDSKPGEFVQVVIEEAAEAVVDGERGVTLANTVADGGTGGGVHTTCGSTHAVDEMW